MVNKCKCGVITQWMWMAPENKNCYVKCHQIKLIHAIHTQTLDYVKMWITSYWKEICFEQLLTMQNQLMIKKNLFIALKRFV